MNSFDQTIKQVPYSLEAEQAVLGAILVDSEQFDNISTSLRSDDFYIDQHVEIYAAMQNLFTESRHIDYVTVIDMLDKKGIFTKEQALKYVKQLADSVPSITNIHEYTEIIKDKALLRRLIKAANEIADSAYEPQESASSTVDAAEQKIFAIAQDKIRGDFSHIRDIIVKNLTDLQSMIDNPDAYTGLKTRFEALDRLLIGMNKGDLIIVGARPGMGKTSFALNVAENVAIGENKTVVIFSLEMSSSQLVLRMLSSVSMIDNYNLRTGKLSDEEWQRLMQSSSKLTKCDIYIDDSSGMNTTIMKAKLRRVKNLGLVIVDYLQLMRSDRKFESNVLEVGDITRSLKLMAKDLKVPIITVAQLSRASETRKDNRPVLSDLRDSGSIEQDADAVMFLYRDEYYNKDNADAQNLAELNLAKNRHGSTGVVKLGWYGQYYKFVEGTDKYDNQSSPEVF